mmetsp:Transcript_6403/g.22899  ORF Transcript_6403/g.22899 Transcript_6403/m.22899 type:complete len:88 (-) Transcript_6403:2289-2552(-)
MPRAPCTGHMLVSAGPLKLVAELVARRGTLLAESARPVVGSDREGELARCGKEGERRGIEERECVDMEREEEGRVERLGGEGPRGRG